ncbi:hypothetical protein KFL_002310030 [Klebsormidium nitens]|uniref:Uncharacterized protein n=1 Tax=Klebsormidium nitens TaxID=105231 RepID=A0A1Y1I9H2_KLENI|nr:hypothetical protein KFL_002310030 [Klebsormidium nitens]|eukprot:GAQ85346.1 hypothetical protein KFL_002310030 [Klebsormidium nitens]
MASLQSARRPGAPCTSPRRAPWTCSSMDRSQSALRAPAIPPYRRSTSALPKPVQAPSSLRPIRTKPAHPVSPATSLRMIPEHSPCSFSSGSSPFSITSPTSSIDPIPWDAAPFIGLAEVEARRRRESLEAALRNRKVFRPAGVAGKGTHRRAELPARPQPSPPKFQEFHLRTEVKGAAAQAEVARKRALKEVCIQLEANRFRATPAPDSLKRGPPVILTRTSPLRRAALRRQAAGACGRTAVAGTRTRQ